MMFVLLALSVTLACVVQRTLAQSNIAITKNGPIIGHRATGSNDVIEWLGIPFAQPPVRFAAPQPYSSKRPLVASQYAATCPQTASGLVAYPDETPQGPRIIAAFAGQLNHTQSDDCLALNIWAKDSVSNRKPVLIFLHGGRWTIGESNTPFFHGARLAATEDIVVVTVDYRVSIFGFPGAPEATKNLALLDQRLAVEWLRDNVAAFGGNPSRMVLAGQSVGGWSVDAWTYAYSDDPIVTGFIAHSGSIFSFPTSDTATAAERWFNVSLQLGCGSSGDTLECMRSKDLQDIKAAVSKFVLPTSTTPGREAVFQPTVDHLTVFPLDEYIRRSKQQRFAQLPTIYGNTHNEIGYYRLAFFGTGGILSDDLWARFNLIVFTCPSTFAAATRSRARLPTWLFRYGGDWDNLRLYPNSSAYHGSDMHTVFGGAEDVSGIPSAHAQLELTKEVMHAWASFAADPWRGLRWPRFREAGELTKLGFDKSAIPVFGSAVEFAALCPTLNLSWYEI